MIGANCPPSGQTIGDAEQPANRSKNPAGGTSALKIANKRNDPLFRRGAVGEYLMSKYLHDNLGDRAVVLDDRKVPGSEANIDHIVVASSGVWIIDSKKWNGTIRFKNVGGLFGNNHRLVVDGRDKTYSTEKIYGYVIPVADLLGDPSIPIRPALAFVDGDWRISTWRKVANRPHQHLGVLLAWPPL
jgi:hypothetical protein